MPVFPDPAATVLALRPSGTRFEVLMVERNSHGFFKDLMVFPGGRVDPHDVAEGHTVDDELSHRMAAIRELAEETGILLTKTGPVEAPTRKGEGFRFWLDANPSTLATDQLVLVSRWVTPEMAPRRFDTRFYLAVCEGAPGVRIDSDELIAHSWVAPAEALRRHEEGKWAMMLPTIAHLRWLQRRESIADALESARGADARTLIAPRRLSDGSIVPVYIPDEAS